jgi:mxaC protein
MSGVFDFESPAYLALLPLALLPLWRNNRETLRFPSVDWLPVDRTGQIIGALWTIFLMLAIAATVLALAGPGRPETQVSRTGRGAEILVLMDRSRSMDDRMLPDDWRKLDPTVRLHHLARGRQKAEVARDLLSQFVAKRKDDRFSLMFFSTRPLSVVPFTQHDAVVQAGIAAGGTGRGLADTDVGRALIAAIEEFDSRAYTGSRIILMVSDGGAHLDEATAQRIRAGFVRDRIALYWIYLRSYNAPALDVEDARRETAPELALHQFFQSLPTPYRAYQADDPQDLAKAVADVGRQQNLPLDYTEQIPRQDYGRYCVAVAALCCLMLLLYRALSIRPVRSES